MTDVFVSHEFKSLVERNGLTGATFKLEQE